MLFPFQPVSIWFNFVLFSYFARSGGESNEESPAAKKLKVDKTVKLAEHEAKIQEKYFGH